MKILIFALSLVAVGLVFWGLNRTIRALAYPKEERYLHCRLIPAVVLTLLAAANVYTISGPMQLLDRIINSPVLAYFFNLILPNRAYELVYMLLLMIGLNLALTLLVISVISTVKLLFSRSRTFQDFSEAPLLEKLLHLPWLMVGLFYEDTNGTPQLNSRGFTMGIWVKGFKRSFLVLWILETLVLAASILWGGQRWNETLLAITKSWYLLPMAGFLILEQLQFFLEGIFDEEAGSFGTSTITEEQSSSMMPLWNAYRQIFSRTNALLYSEISGSHIPVQDGLGSNDLGNQQLDDCRQPDVLHVLSNQLSQCGVLQSEQYQNALVELLNGSSINICDHCEGEFLTFLCAYLNYYMSQGRTVLMLCRDSARAEELCQAVNQQMHRLNNLYSIWDIRTLEGAEINSRMSMLICSVDEFLDHHISEKRRDFTGDLFCAILADGMELFSGDNIQLERLFVILRGIDGIRQYVAFSNTNNDALRTAMEQAIKREFLPFTNDFVHHPYSGVMVWRSESCHQLQRQIGVGGPMSPYLGAALPLALVAVKFDFPRVYLITDSSHGDRSFSDALAMSSKEATTFLGKSVNLKNVLRHHLDEALRTQELSVTVVYDTDYNFFNALMRWKKYGGTNGSLLHIISPPYALREYFAANYNQKRLYLKNNEFDALVSNHLGTRISHMAVLLVSLCENGLTESELMETVKEYHWEYENVEDLLLDCLRVVLTREEIHSVYECFHFEEEKHFCENQSAFQVQTRITLMDATIRRRLHELVGHAQLICKDDQHQTLPILRGNLPNYCLRDQILPVDGYLYQIRSICGGTLYGEQLLPTDLPEYHQISEFSFTHYQQSDCCVDTGLMDLNLCTADVTRRVHGYWSTTGGCAFTGSCDVQVSNLGQVQEVVMEGVNILELKVRRSEFDGKAQEAMRLLAFLLKDFSKTLFPMTHQNLFTAVSEGTDADLIPRILALGSKAPLDDIVSSLIPRVIDPPNTDSSFITIYVVEASCIEFGMVQMLYSRWKQVLLMVREYLSWYLESGTPAEGDGSSVRGSYLHFGSDAIPGILAPDALLALCRKLTQEDEPASDPVEITMDVDVPKCTFCGRPSLFPTRLSDGRQMCGHCKDHQLTQRDEIKSMFKETVRYLKEGYGIALPTNLHIRFQSADAIARATGGCSDGRILGFYNAGSHQLWLEARGPRIAMQSTLIHELTHAWQFHDPEFSRLLPQVLRRFPRKDRNRMRLLLLEGHAVYMEIESMRKMHEDPYADRIHASSMQRNDEYGQGYRLVRGYIADLGDLGSYMTPYKAMIQLLRDILDGKVTIS